MEIRKLATADYEQMIRLWSKAKLPYKPKGRDSKKAIAAQIRKNPDFFLGAFENKNLVGVAILSCDTRKGWINRLAVDPDYRHRGVAVALIGESEKVLREHGINIFCALIEDYNVASQALFKKCGYIVHHDIVYYSKRDSDEV